MENCCEICTGFLSRARLERSAIRVVAVPFEERTLLLCTTHAYIAAEFGISTVSALRHLFRESTGRRSFMPRRRAPDKAARSGEQRSLRGRRATDWN